jgi:hypothetical protein
MLEILETIGKWKANCLCSRCKSVYEVPNKYSAQKSRVGDLCSKCKRAVVDMGEPTQAKLQQAFNYDPDTGVLSYKYETLRSRAGEIAGFSHQGGYLAISLDNKQYLLHRIIFMYVAGYMPEMVDHINHKRDDNRWVNLRDVSALDNTKNTSISQNSTTKINGVSFIKSTGRYRAYINRDYKQIHIGIYATQEEAIEARRLADIEHNYHENHGI